MSVVKSWSKRGSLSQNIDGDSLPGLVFLEQSDHLLLRLSR